MVCGTGELVLLLFLKISTTMAAFSGTYIKLLMAGWLEGEIYSRKFFNSVSSDEKML